MTQTDNSENNRAKEIRTKVQQLSAEYHELTRGQTTRHHRPDFMMPSGACFDAEDRTEAVLAALDLELSGGQGVVDFERTLSKKIDMRSSMACNSGSSANLLAFATLCDPSLDGHIEPGSEVITSAVEFPTTVSPILQYGCVPVIVDADPQTGNLDLGALEAALSPRTRAVMSAHTLGSPYRADLVREFADSHGLWFIEDNCDALGADIEGRPTGSFGNLSSLSFYPAHHITSGEGGCVSAESVQVAAVTRSLRDWGRDCWCAPGEDDRCMSRFNRKLPGLPEGFDHKYVFSRVGYNLKMSDLQARVLTSQLQKSDMFTAVRNRNWDILHEYLNETPGIHVLTSAEGTGPSWFGFAFVLDEQAKLSRSQLQVALEQVGIGSRVVFAGNIMAQPMLRGRQVRTIGDLPVANRITRDALWVGVYPGLSQEDMHYMGKSIRRLVTEGR